MNTSARRYGSGPNWSKLTCSNPTDSYRRTAPVNLVLLPKNMAFAPPLLVIATAQLMLVLDDSIVNIALPSIQKELGVDAVHLPWVVNAYILALGALLLLGGRIGDLYGRRRALQAGLALFVVASLAGGLGPNSETLIAARAVQGLGAALVAPNALALITTTFSERKSRDVALSLYGAMAGLGIVVGLLLGGVLTGTLGWRWVFFINIPIGIFVLLGSRALVEAEKHSGSLDLRGAVLGTGGMVALVYAITRFGEDGYTDALGLGLTGAAVLLLAAFIATQSRSRTPLVPLSLFRDRSRAGAYASMLLLAIGPMGSFYVITLYLQQVQHYGPLQTGASWLPFAAGLVVGAGAAPKLLLKVAPRVIAAAGPCLVPRPPSGSPSSRPTPVTGCTWHRQCSSSPSDSASASSP